MKDNGSKRWICSVATGLKPVATEHIHRFDILPNEDCAATFNYPSIGTGLGPLLDKAGLDSIPLPSYLRTKKRQRPVAAR